MATIDKKQGTQLGAAFAFAAISSAVIAAGAPMLFPDFDQLSAFQVFWSVIFAFSGILNGLNLEATRTISAANSPQVDVPANRPNHHFPKVIPVAAALSLALSALLAISAYWWGNWQFPSHSLTLALTVAFGVAGCGVYMVIGGVLAGSGNWNWYARLISTYAALQLVLVVTVALVSQSVTAAALATAVSFYAGIGFLLFSPTVRSLIAMRAQSNLRTLLLQFGAAALASGASAVLVIGFPALLTLTTPPADIEASAPPLFQALILTRAPLMIPLNAVQGVVVAHFSRQKQVGVKALLPILLIAMGVGAVAVAGAWLLGPWLLNAIWGAEMVVSGPMLGALTAGATGLAVISLTGAVCQSLARHRSFVAGWIMAVLTAILLLLLPLPLFTRAAIALGVGPIVGIIIHLISLGDARLKTEGASYAR